MSPIKFTAALLALAAAVSAQTGRTTALSGAPLIGTTFNVVVNYPLAVAGNVYGFMYSPPFAGSVTFPPSPPFTFNGDFLVDPNNTSILGVGTYGPSGSESMPITVPNTVALVGLALDAQAIEVDTTQNFFLADNDVQIVVQVGIGNIEITSATTTSLTTGNNDLQFVNNTNIGTPTSYGQPLFSYLPVRHRGDEGFVEGYAGTFSSTSHNSDIDSVSLRRNGRRTANGAYQTLTLANGYELSIIRDLLNGRQFAIASYNRASGLTTVIPGTTWTDTGTSATPTQQNFYFGVSRDGQWGALYLRDSNTTATGFLPRVLAFRTDGSQPAIDITPAAVTAVTQNFFDGSLIFSNDFIIASGAAGFFWTSATSPAQMQPLSLGNTVASNAPNVFAFQLSWRVSPDGSKIYMPIASNTAAVRAEMDLVQITNNAGVPLVTNWSQFAAPTGLAEMGYSALPLSVSNSATTLLAATVNTASSNNIKCSVSPDGNKVAILGATTTSNVFPGIYVIDGTANPVLYTVPGANVYSEVAFINDTTVMFFAGTAVTTGASGAYVTTIDQSLFKLDLTAGNQLGAISQIGTATNIRTRGSFWSLNKDFWYFVRSNNASTVNNIVGVNCTTGTVFDVTGSEFGTSPSPVGDLLSGSFNATQDPWFALEMQLRRAPVGDYAYFTARRVNGAGVEDANLFRFDIENGGQAVALTPWTATGTGAGSVFNLESLVISDDGNHVAFTRRVGTASTATTPEEVFHLNLLTNTLVQMSQAPAATTQTVTDGSVRFVGGTSPFGLVWSLGTGTATTVPTANAVVQFGPLGGGTPTTITPAPAGTRLFQVIGTH
jgi:hypothetical protein